MSILSVSRQTSTPVALPPLEEQRVTLIAEQASKLLAQRRSPERSEAANSLYNINITWWGNQGIPDASALKEIHHLFKEWANVQKQGLLLQARITKQEKRRLEANVRQAYLSQLEPSEELNAETIAKDLDKAERWIIKLNTWEKELQSRAVTIQTELLSCECQHEALLGEIDEELDECLTEVVVGSSFDKHNNVTTIKEKIKKRQILKLEAQDVLSLNKEIKKLRQQLKELRCDETEYLSAKIVCFDSMVLRRKMDISTDVLCGENMKTGAIELRDEEEKKPSELFRLSDEERQIARTLIYREEIDVKSLSKETLQAEYARLNGEFQEMLLERMGCVQERDRLKQELESSPNHVQLKQQLANMQDQVNNWRYALEAAEKDLDEVEDCLESQNQQSRVEELKELIEPLLQRLSVVE